MNHTWYHKQFNIKLKGKNIRGMKFQGKPLMIKCDTNNDYICKYMNKEPVTMSLIEHKI
jgi:hypothetical protein